MFPLGAGGRWTAVQIVCRCAYFGHDSRRVAARVESSLFQTQRRAKVSAWACPMSHSFFAVSLCLPYFEVKDASARFK